MAPKSTEIRVNMYFIVNVYFCKVKHSKPSTLILMVLNAKTDIN